MDSEKLVLQGGVSAELRSIFNELNAKTVVNGEAVWSTRVCRDLVKAISCRTYAGAIYELCHLIYIADANHSNLKPTKMRPEVSNYVNFFHDSLGHSPARASSFKGAINHTRLENQTWRGTKVTAHGQGVDICYPDGVFTVTFGRMPFLSALNNFLLDTVGFRVMNDVYKEMLVTGISKASVSMSAKKLSRLLYKYLKNHLPTAQRMRKFRSLIDYMKKRMKERYCDDDNISDILDFKSSDIDDEAILDFWTYGADEDPFSGNDFKTYETVFKTFLHLRQAIEHAEDLYALEGAHSIGTDFEAGEIEPSTGKFDPHSEEVNPFTILAIVELVDEYRSSLLALQEAPVDAIKFLNKKERVSLELLMDCGKMASDLSLSLMRCEVFSPGQRRITQALRRKASASELRNVINGCTSSTYEQRVEEFSCSSFHIDSMLLASLYVLVRAQNKEAISLIVTLRPNLDLVHFGKLLGIDDQMADNIIMFNPTIVSERFMAMIDDEREVGPDMVALMAEARKAFGDVSRQGFSTNTLDDGAVIDGFASGSRALLIIRDHLADFCRTLENEPSWNTQFNNDKNLFSRQFTILYKGN